MVLGSSLGFKGTGKGRVNQQNPRGDGVVESHVSQKTRNMATPSFLERTEMWATPPLGGELVDIRPVTRKSLGRFVLGG
jgi:hypothetical protein